VYRNPTPADVFVDTAEDLYTALLHEANQLHVLAQGGGSEISGEFIVQARADFETSLKQTKSALDAALTWCFDTVLTLAAAIAGDPTHFDALKISGSAIINSGPLSIGERQAIISAYEKGLLSKETAVRMLGAENVSAELERIEAEESARLNTLKLQAEILEILGRSAVALPAAVQTVQDGEISDATIRGDFVIGGDDE
jgi:tartrate dehydratase alpha subunit/fumarate hydratase class I-like protein